MFSRHKNQDAWILEVRNVIINCEHYDSSYVAAARRALEDREKCKNAVISISSDEQEAAKQLPKRNFVQSAIARLEKKAQTQWEHAKTDLNKSKDSSDITCPDKKKRKL